MCNSPIVVNPYSTSFGSAIEVPCNNCSSCRYGAHESWLLRIGLQYRNTIDSGGKCLFLTFTYRPSCLPTSDFGISDKPILVFNKCDVDKFLNNLKVLSHRKFGPDAYKYFQVSEYGSKKHRPHYHIMFFVAPNVDYQEFTELCRKVWHYGYTFPKLTSRGYVDSKGRPYSPVVDNAYGCCKYAAKYVTKDLDFMGLSVIKSLLDEYGSLSKLPLTYRNYLPFHRQSKGFGKLVLSPLQLKNYITNGIFNPVTLKQVQLPRYYIESNAFHVKTFKIDGVTYYHRDLLPEYSDVVRQLHSVSLSNKVKNYYKFFLNLKSQLFVETGLSLNDYVNVTRYIFDASSLVDVYSKYLFYSLNDNARILYASLSDNVSIDSFVNYRMALYNPYFDYLAPKFNTNLDYSCEASAFKTFLLVYRFVLSHKSDLLESESERVRILKLYSKGLL